MTEKRTKELNEWSAEVKEKMPTAGKADQDGNIWKTPVNASAMAGYVWGRIYDAQEADFKGPQNTEEQLYVLFWLSISG